MAALVSKKCSLFTSYTTGRKFSACVSDLYPKTRSGVVHLTPLLKENIEVRTVIIETIKPTDQAIFPPPAPQVQEQVLAKICNDYLSKNKVPSPEEVKKNVADTPWIPDLSIYISSLFTKNFSNFMGEQLAVASRAEDKKLIYITNIYLMLSMFISTMSLLGIQTRILPLVFGQEAGNLVDYIYKGAITIAALTIRVHNPKDVLGKVIDNVIDKLEFDIPDMSMYQASNADAGAQAALEYARQEGGSPALYTLEEKVLEDLHNRIRVNLEKILNAVAEMA